MVDHFPLVPSQGLGTLRALSYPSRATPCKAGKSKLSCYLPSRRAMVVPLAGRVIAACVGGLLVITAARSVIGTIIVPRPVGSWLTRWVDKLLNGTYLMATARITDHKTRDRVLAGQAAAILLAQLFAWLAIFFVGFTLLL